MAAYAVFFREGMLDHSELAIYTSKVLESWSNFEAFSPKLLVASGEHDVIEGGLVEGVVILEFPNLELARAWYHSPAYQEILQHRLKGGVFKSIIVSGVASSPS
ncbi:DUF1330 domain-containing protein [Agrobacterium deltaense]